MNAGFTNLETLRAQLLGRGLAGEKNYDTQIAAIGLGMAGSIEQYCQRKFFFGQTSETFVADRVHFLLSQTPLLSVDKMELKHNETDGFIVQDATFVQTIDYDKGILYLPPGPDPGEYTSLFKVTYTGGYFWETLEKDSPDYPSDLPAGAALLPDDVRLAWFLQCEQIWSKRDKLGLGITDKPDTQASLDDIKLIPMVKQLLANYVKINPV